MNRNLLILCLSLLEFSCSKKDKGSPPSPSPPPPIAIKLESSSFTIGNTEKNVLDTFVLNYNKAITVNYILLISNTCLPDIERVVINDGKTVKFYHMLCAWLGRDYQFQVSVRDNEGKTKIDTVRFSYYTRKFPVEGEIMHYSISADNKFAWITTANPNRIVCLGIEDSTYKKSYDLNFKPGKFQFNPQNQKLYILPYAFYQPDPDHVYIMNPANGNIDKVLIIPKDQYDSPTSHIQVYDLEFGYNGFGVIITGTLEYGLTRWRIIDSRLNDTTYAHPEWVEATYGNGNYHFGEFASLHVNYNRTKIIMQMNYAFPQAGVLDCDNGNLSALIFASTNPNHYLVTSKTEDKLFVASYGFQSIYSNSSWSGYSNFDNRYSSHAEFSYRPGDQDVIYYRNKDYSYEFVLIDYYNLKILSRTNVSPDFVKINATTDGKYVLAVTGGGLYLWDTNIFYKYL